MTSSSKKEIVIITGSLQTTNGISRMLSQLASEWARSGHDVTAILIRDDGVYPSFQINEAVNIIRMPKASRIRLVRIVKDQIDLGRILKTMPNATLIAFQPNCTFKCGLLSLSLPNRIIASVRNDPTKAPNGRVSRALRTWGLGRADVCVFQTEYAKNLFSKKIRRKGVIIPNPINASLPSPYKGVRTKTIVSACRLAPQKNIPVSIRAFARLHEDHPDYVFDIYGDGPLHDEIEALIESEGLGGYVRLHDFVEDIHERMNSAAMFVSTSDYEGISNSMLEAIALGVPSVVTDCPVGGARQTVQDGVNGLLIPVGDVDACYHAMKRIIEEPGLAERLSAEAVKIREQLPISAIAQRWIDLM